MEVCHRLFWTSRSSWPGHRIVRGLFSSRAPVRAQRRVMAAPAAAAASEPIRAAASRVCATPQQQASACATGTTATGHRWSVRRRPTWRQLADRSSRARPGQRRAVGHAGIGRDSARDLLGCRPAMAPRPRGALHRATAAAVRARCADTRDPRPMWPPRPEQAGPRRRRSPRWHRGRGPLRRRSGRASHRADAAAAVASSAAPAHDRPTITRRPSAW